MNLTNDNTCGWIQDLDLRKNINNLNNSFDTEFLIVGAGFTGLSAARKISELFPNKLITIVDAQRAGEGASSRNSGYLVDTTLNDGFSSNKELQSYKIKTNIYKLGIKSVKSFIDKHQVDCDWNESGKYFASSKKKDVKILNYFSKILNKLDFENKILDKTEMCDRIGTNFYNVGLYTKGGILLHPAKLCRAMINALPANVKLFIFFLKSRS